MTTQRHSSVSLPPLPSFISLIVSMALGSFFLSLSLWAQLPNPTLVGYWHNWNDNNAPYLYLDSLDTRYNVITVAFAIPTSNSDMTMQFVPDRGTAAEFIQRMQRVQAQGKKILLSVGGATAYIDLSSTTNKNAFISSMTTLLSTYGFDGMDVDIESGPSILITSGTIAAPQNTAQLNLIDALRQIMANYRSSFSRKMLLTMAPETAYIQGGMSGFGNIWGGYLPIVHALRDSLDLLHVQLYNSGTMYGIDGNIYTQGTADFIIAMTEAVIRGFNTSGGVFAGLVPSKVAVGLPASTSAAGGGFVDSTTVYKALQYLLGKGSRPGQYTLAQQGGYPALRGMMTWSVNWDALGGNRSRYSYANGYYNVFAPPPPPLAFPDKVVLVSPTADEQLRVNNLRFQWQPSYPAVTHYQLELKTKDSVLLNDSTIILTELALDNLLPATSYSWRVRAKNSRGWGEWSDVRRFHSLPFPLPVVQSAPDSNAQLHTNTVQLRWKKSVPDVKLYHLVLSNEVGTNITDTTLNDTVFTCSLQAAQRYRWRVQAKNISGWGAWSSDWIFHSLSFPTAVILLSPAHTAELDADSIRFSWESAQPTVSAYRFALYNADTLVYTDSTLRDTTLDISPLQRGIEYFWQVQARNESGWGEWSTWWRVRLKKDSTTSSVTDTQQSMLPLFPNPAESIVELRTPESIMSTIYIVDMLGRVVLQTEANGKGTQRIDISLLQAGTYTLRIADRTQILVKL